MSIVPSEENGSTRLNSAEITFHLIYVKGVVRRLKPFLKSLLRHSDCRYNLISNACTNEEEELLKELSLNNERLSFHSLNATEMLYHHDVLKQLLDKESSPYFAILDTDMMATGNFVDEWLNAMDNHDAVFTGLPMWHEEAEMRMPRDFMIMGGRFWRSHNDYILGLTYGAIYRTQSLKHFIQSSGVSFDRFKWNEVPETHQQTLMTLDLKKEIYDTAKVLNILWQHAGASTKYIPLEAVIHLGGVSGPETQKGIQPRWRNVLDKCIILFSWLLKKLIGRKASIPLKENLNIVHLRMKRGLSGFISKNLLEEDITSIEKSVGVFKDYHFRKQIIDGVLKMKGEIKKDQEHSV